MNLKESQASVEASPAMTPQQARLSASDKSRLQMYREMAVGQSSWAALAWYELATLFASNTPGLLGLLLRGLLFPSLCKSCSAMPALGRGITLRQPNCLTLGRKVVIDEYVSLDARGADAQILLAEHVSIGRFSSIVARNSKIALERAVNIGSYCRIASESGVSIGESSLVAAYCYVGPGNHGRGDANTPLISAPMERRGGVSIGKHVWLGTGATVLDGVSVGDKAIVGAHSLVREDVAPGAVVAGTPARVIG
jgi:acetyltransferase-like isoleucine patch superfamily enzyme